MKHIKKLKIDIDKNNFEVIPSVQYDSNTRFLHIQLLDGAVPLDITGCSAIISGIKPDGKSIFNSCNIINSKTGFIEAEVTEQMNVMQGDINCEIKIYDGNGVLTTKKFVINVTSSYTSREIESTGEFKALTKALNEVQNIDNKFSDVYSHMEQKAEEVDLNILKNRMDSFTSLDKGSTTGDAELIDTRTKADGSKAINSGNGVREQIKSIVNYSGSYINTDSYDRTLYLMVVSNLQIFKDEAYKSHRGMLIPVQQNTICKISRQETSDVFRIALLSKSEGENTGTLYLNLDRLILNDNSKNEFIFNTGNYEYIALQYSSSNKKTKIDLIEGYKVNLNESVYIKEIDDAKKDINEKIYPSLRERINANQKSILNTLSCSNINIYDNTVAEIYNDFNNFPVNKIVCITAYQNTIKNSPYSGFLGNVLTYNYTDNTNSTGVQIATDNNNVMYFRVKYGTNWDKFERVITYKPDYMLMFHKIGGIGDSLMTGELSYGLESEGWQGHYKDRPTFSWLSNIARTTGAEYVCYSEGGLKANTWFERGWDTKLKNESQKCSAYFIGLGTNDKSYTGYGLGTIDDTSGTQSFVGYYKKIIETIQSVAPNAVIFCLSLYDKKENSIPYSNMIQAITSKYNKCYFVDFANKSDILLSDTNYTSWGHFDTLGYIRVADNIKRICNDIIESKRKELYMFGWDNN